MRIERKVFELLERKVFALLERSLSSMIGQPIDNINLVKYLNAVLITRRGT